MRRSLAWRTCWSSISAQAALAGDMTVSMLFAFISYKHEFVDKAARLVERAIEYRMLDQYTN
jgi:ATP-binding cassette subfamily B protein RaxB